MNYTAEQLVRILIEKSTVSESSIKHSDVDDSPDSIHNCKRVVELVRELDAKANIQDEEFYQLCLRFCEYYATDDISIQYVYDFAAQLTNKVLFS